VTVPYSITSVGHGDHAMHEMIIHGLFAISPQMT